jgi:beta-lactamase superfamily II metal-dependent hydrolase
VEASFAPASAACFPGSHKQQARILADKSGMRALVVLQICILVVGCSLVPSSPGQVGNGDPPGGGSWQPGWLEIHHIDAGPATSTLVVGPSGRSLLIDAGEGTWDSEEGASVVGAYLRNVLGTSHLDYVLVSHFHLDHTGAPGHGGLWHLFHRQGVSVEKLLHRDFPQYQGEGGATLDHWREYLAGEGRSLLHPEVARLGAEQIDLGPGVSTTIIAVDGNGRLNPGMVANDPSPPNENDYSVALVLRYGQLDYFTGGDLSGETLVSGFGYTYHDIEQAVAPRTRDIDVYRVSHHASAHSSSPTLLAQMKPRVSIIEVDDDNDDGHPHQATVDRLIGLGPVYLTGRGSRDTDLRGGRVVGTVVLACQDGVEYWVAGDRYLASDPARIDADGDGYFREADPDDAAAGVVPPPRGGCDFAHQNCR